MRSTPWYHQKRSESAPPAQRPRDPPSMSAREQDELVDRISKPTESALYRQSLYWKLDGFMERGFHSWSKMDLFNDCKRCMWEPNGTVKSSCKIRPNNTVPSSLPPLRSGRSSVSVSGSGSVSSRNGRDSLTTPKNGNNGNGSHHNGFATCRASRDGGRPNTNNKAALANGLAALGGVNGARYRLHNSGASRLPSGGSNSYPANSLAVPRIARTTA